MIVEVTDVGKELAGVSRKPAITVTVQSRNAASSSKVKRRARLHTSRSAP